MPLATMEWPWEAYAPWLEKHSIFRAAREPSFRIQVMMWKRMAWRTRLLTKVSSRLQSTRTQRPPTMVEHQAQRGS